jgi:MFS family permease
MFGLAPVLGGVVDAMGRRPAMSLGLVVVATGALGLALGPTLGTILPSIFLVGAGWNLAYLSGTALVADATSPHERASALGALDLGGLVGAAITTVLAPAVLDVAGLGPLVVVAAVIALVPAVLLFNARRVAPASS